MTWFCLLYLWGLGWFLRRTWLYPGTAGQVSRLEYLIYLPAAVALMPLLWLFQVAQRWYRRVFLHWYYQRF